MKTKGEVLQKVNGGTKGEAEKFGLFIVLLGIAGAALFFTLAPHMRTSDEEGFFVVMGGFGIIDAFLGVFLMAKFRSSNYAKTYIEICANGVNVMPLNKNELFISYDEIKSVSVSGGILATVSIQNRYNVNTSLRVLDQQVAIQLCDTIRESAKKYADVLL